MYPAGMHSCIAIAIAYLELPGNNYWKDNTNILENYLFFFINLKSRVEKVIKGLSCRDLDCQLCKKSYSSAHHLRNHLRKKHLGKTPYKCNICNKFYTDSSTLKDHMRHHDPAAKKFKCSKCPKEYFSKSRFIKERHSTVHTAPDLTIISMGSGNIR